MQHRDIARVILARLYAKQREARRCKRLDAVSCYDSLIASFCVVFPDAAATVGQPPTPRLSRPTVVRVHGPQSRVLAMGEPRGHDAPLT